MGRKALILSPLEPYHVCARSNNRDWFKVPLPTIWEIFSECLSRTQELFSCEYYGFVLMANHFHLLIGTPQENLGEAMRHLMTESSRRIARGSNRINRIFGARYRWTILYGDADYAYVYKYVYRNPVRGKASQTVETYAFSTLTKLVEGTCNIPICDRIDKISRLVPRDISTRLAWLNQPTSKEAEALIGKGLRRFEFKFTTNNLYQKDLRNLKAEYGVGQL